MIHDELVSFETAKLAKEKGFNEYVDAFYAEDCDTPHLQGPEKWNNYDGKYAAPTQSLLQRWLREEKNIVVEAGYYSVERKYYWRVYDTSKCDVFASFIPPSKSMSRYDTWEQVLEYGLEYALKELE